MPSFPALIRIKRRLQSAGGPRTISQNAAQPSTTTTQQRMNVQDFVSATKLAIQKLEQCCPGGVASGGLNSALSAVVVVMDLIKATKMNEKSSGLLLAQICNIINDILIQAEVYETGLPAETVKSVGEITNLLNEVIVFMKQVESQRFYLRLVRQDRHKTEIQDFERRLKEAMERFNNACHLASIRLHYETLKAAHMTEEERQMLVEISSNTRRPLGHKNGVLIGLVFFFTTPFPD